MSELTEITKLANQLRAVANNLPIRGQSGLKNSAVTLVNALREASPVHSGKFRSGWRAKLAVGGGKHNIASLSIYNTTGVYGVFISGGSGKGERPWPQAVLPPKGHTTEYEGRIYPYVAPGGPAEIVLKTYNFDELTKNVADTIFSGLNG